MELNVTISVVVLLPVALAFVAGGLILYRRSTREGWQAAGIGSMALGVGVLLCWQSAQVGQIRIREDYYYEELRGSSLRVLL